MDKWNEINEFMGAPLGKKYDFTWDNDNLYYLWGEKNDIELLKPGFNWNGYFDIPEPIDFKSTQRPSGKTKKVEFPAVKKYNFEKQIIEVGQLEPTGYLTPRFRFINIQFNRYDYKGDEYKQALETFGISESGTIPPEKIPLVSNYRDTLLKQLYRQAEQINELNKQIANVLKVYYYESEQAIIKSFSDENTEEENKSIGIDWSNVLQNIRNLFETLILRGAKTELIERHSMLKRLQNNSYVSEHIIETTIHGVLTLSKKKDPLINMAVLIAGKINPLESILEDALMNNRIRANKDYLRDNLMKDEIIQKAHDLKNDGMKDEPLFNHFKKWLFDDLGFTNSELKERFNFELHEHEEAHKTFSRFVNKNRPHTNRNK